METRKIPEVSSRCWILKAASCLGLDIKDFLRCRKPSQNHGMRWRITYILCTCIVWSLRTFLCRLGREKKPYTIFKNNQGPHLRAKLSISDSR